MCGIAGYFGLNAPPEERVRECLRLMHHRGPDHAAHRRWTSPAGRTALLLHTRLSIIDLDPRAHQPFGAGSKWIAYNGEVYNYVELRRQLASEGATFRTESDTEVLVQLLDRWGIEGLDRAEGMWAFAVYDESDGSLTLSRDRFGEKPLYLHRSADGLYFGSEAKFVFALLGRRLPPNLDQVSRFLVNGYRTLYRHGETFFEGVEELPAASVLRLEAGGEERCKRHWSPRIEVDPGMTYETAVAGTREQLIRSVERRLRADVPLAFCMSGGIDSIGLIAIARRTFGYDVHGFTVVNADARYEEQEFVDHAVTELGIRHTSLPVRPDRFLERLRALVRQHDAPVFTISYYAHAQLMERIRDAGYRVAVSGTGADELFSGYYDHHLLYLAEIREDAARWREAREEWQRHVRPLTRNRCLQDPDLFVRDPGFRGHLDLDAESFAGYLRAPSLEPFTERRHVDGLLRNRMLNELFVEAVPVILHEDDLNAMAYSIENRSPYLDRELFEFSSRIPTRHLIRDGRAKAVLRDALREIAPSRILDNRRKVGFNVPIDSYLDIGNPVVRREVLEAGPIYDLVRRDRIEALLGQPERSETESKFLFSFLSAKMFLEELGGSEV